MPISIDTDRNVDEILIAGYREMEPRKKLAQASAMTRTVLQLAAARIRKQHDGISDRELMLRMASLWLDRDTLVRAFGWDPDKEGY
jgi:hypothetical protein